MRAGQFYTNEDSTRNYELTRKALATYSDSELIGTYHETLRDSFDRMFGHNAKGFFNLVADELLRRGINELPNIFGPIQVKHIEGRN